MERQLRMRAIYWVQSDPNRPLRLSSETLEKVHAELSLYQELPSLMKQVEDPQPPASR